MIIHAGKGSTYLSKADLAKYETAGVVAISILCGCANKSDALAGKIQKVPDVVIDRLKTDVHAEGPFCWFLDSVKPLEFVPMKGKQGLFDPTPEDWESLIQANPDLPEWIEFMLRGSSEHA